MDSGKSWFQRLRHKEEKLKPGSTKTKETENPTKSTTDDVLSNDTKEKVAAAKQYIENHYKAQMKCLQDRKER